VPRPAFVVAQGLEQIILALVGEPWHRLLAGKIGPVARVAVVLLGQCPGPLEPRRIAGI
jgi:hypothetical protein